MSEPQPQTRSTAAGPATDPIRHFLLGAIPGTVAIVIALIHLRAPLVHTEHQVLLAMACLALVCTSLAAWLYYTSQRESRRLDERYEEIVTLLGEIAESLAEQHDERTKSIEALDRAIQGIHRRAEAIERQGKALGEAFIEEGNPLSSYRGPRPLT